MHGRFPGPRFSRRYGDLQSDIKNEALRSQALRSVTTQPIELRWSIGMSILERQKINQRGSGAVGRQKKDQFAAEARRELADAERLTAALDWEQP